ncbi:hypothetical protein Stube_09840 [Streptomyces tubercidicus]|uniref:Transposase IS4-like domain-containing protein n=1 Tax=Streptomyces tubercidicus TaxID=47759 RepID=A0A640UNR4_9ACTN|nr:hypothetical protein Stube_09840 [Streptomyces tubercidicus]
MIDSQSVKADAVVGADSRGLDGGKLVNGHKRHVVVDTLGLLLGVTAAAGHRRQSPAGGGSGPHWFSSSERGFDSRHPLHS